MAALGAIGDPAGLPAVLGALEDKPAIRRRAAVALAAFEGPAVDAALRRCLDDRDWQVRQVAEDLLVPGVTAGHRRGQDSAAAKMGRRLSKESRHRPAPSTTHSSGVATRCTGTSVSSASRLARPRSMAPPADQVDPLVDDVLGQLGRGLAQALDHGGHDQVDLVAEGVAHLLGGDHHRLGQAGRDLAPAHLGLAPRRRRAGPSRWPA